MNNESIVTQTNIDNTHVPDKVYAFMIQSHHMLYELINCQKGDMVSIEVFDDVGVEHEDGTKDAIQLKSALSNRNPVSNKAVDLWKTLYNWLISIEVGVLDVDSVKFILFITVNKGGTIADSFSSAKTEEEASVAWENAKQSFYEDDGSLKEIGEECRKFVEYFFAIERKDIVCKMIEKFELKKCIDNYTVTVRKEFDKMGIPQDIVEPIYRGIIGWIDISVTQMIENGEIAIISYEKYQKQLWALIREYNQRHSLMTYSTKPSDDAVQEELQKQRTYIEQLDIIECDYTQKVEAINDYLRAATDRTIWADNGDVSLQSIQIYEEKLKRSWNLQRNIVMLQNKNDPAEEQGQLIYYKCQEKKVEMDAVNVPEFFQNGCFHALSEELEVGWHPEYLKKIERKKK